MNQLLRRAKKVPTKRIMGVDASLNSTGYAFIDTDGEVVTNRITPGTKKGSTRLWHNLLSFRSLLGVAQPEVIVLEGYAMGAKGQVFQIGEWGGVLRLEAWRHKVDIITVTPGTLKYAATGSGAAKKPEMMAACQDLFGLTIAQDDEADAYLLHCFGRALLHHLGPKAFVDRVLEKEREKKSGISREPGARQVV